jgi:8-amino-7-oxononanoate synthase
VGVLKLGRLWKGLYRAGIFTQAVVPPAVPPDGIRLRLSLTAEHTNEDLDRILEAFQRVGRRLGMI